MVLDVFRPESCIFDLEGNCNGSLVIQKFIWDCRPGRGDREIVDFYFCVCQHHHTRFADRNPEELVIIGRDEWDAVDEIVQEFSEEN